MMKKPEYEVILLSKSRPEDKEDVLRVWENNLYTKEEAEQRWDWFFTNPITALHFLLKVDGVTEGSVSVVLKSFCKEKHYETAGLLTDMSVNKEHRGMKPAMLLLKDATQGTLNLGCSFLYGTPSTNSYPIFKRKFKKLADYKKYVKVLKSHSTLVNRMPAVIADFVAPLVDKGLAIVDWFRYMKNGYNPNQDALRAFVTSYSHKSYPFECDQPWWDTASKLSLLIGDRTPYRAKWRYTDIDDKGTWRYNYRFFQTTYGTLVYFLDEEMRASVIDFFIDPSNESSFLKLMCLFERYLKTWQQVTAISVEFAGLPHIHETLQKLGYKERVNGHDIWIDKDAEIDLESSFWTSAEGDFL